MIIYGKLVTYADVDVDVDVDINVWSSEGVRKKRSFKLRRLEFLGLKANSKSTHKREEIIETLLSAEQGIVV